MRALGANNGVGAVPFLVRRGISGVDLAVARRKIDYPEIKAAITNELRPESPSSSRQPTRFQMLDDEVARFGYKRRSDLRKN